MINMEQTFTPRVNPADANYPFGSIKDNTSPGTNDGTPLAAVWGNDWEGFAQAAMTEAGIVPSGLPDTAQDSQLLDAVKAVTSGALADKITSTGELPLKGDGYKSTSHYGGVIVGDNPLGAPGDDWPDALSLRDAINVSRKILNEPTDCHAFADKTVIDSPNDYGGYGAFDATTIVRGSHTQDHVASFQARTQYNGTGRIKNLWGMICWPTASSTGTVENYTAINLVGVATSTATVENATFIDILPQPVTGANVGVLVRNSSAPTSISFNSMQDSTGYSWYGNGGGVMYQKGKAFFGFDGKTNPLAIYKINASDDTGTTVAGVGADSGNGGYSAVGGDNQYSIFTNGAPRLTVLKSNNSYSTVPGLSDGTAYLGNVSNRWAAVYAVNGTIQTSDAREKTAPARIDDAVLDAWGDVQIIAFQWLSSVAQKGDLARWHFGVIAQQVRDAFIARGLDGTKYGLLCYDEWDGQDEITCESVVVKPAVEAGNRWGVRADQCLFLEAAYQRRRSDRIEARLLALESK